jgi:ABC-type multidrug transport system ATPase subunit
MALVEIRELSRTFSQGKEKTEALKKVSFGIEKGEIFGLLGPNGAGKTTLVNILGGVLTPTSGSASIFGLDVEKEMDKIVSRVNICSGDTTFHWALKTKHILNFYGRVYGLDASERKERIAYLAKKFEIEDLMEKKFGWFSSGQKTRVILCKALINQPEFVMLDEPTLRLDPDIAKKTRELVLEINKDLGTTILLASHYMSEVEQLCGRIGFLFKGCLVDIGTIEKVKALRFSSYKVKIKLKMPVDFASLKEQGFAVEEREGLIMKELNEEDELAEVLDGLVHKGYRVLDVKTQRPTLEDYFLKMTSGEGEAAANGTCAVPGIANHKEHEDVKSEETMKDSEEDGEY